MVSAGYWADWTAGTLAPEKIDWTKFDFINFAFATPQSDASIKFSDGDRSTALLKRLISSAHANGKKVVLSLGGWGNSNGFSGAVSSQSLRSTFIKNVQSLQSKYGLDGFDFDWEYPNNVQGGPTDPSDTKNFQTFLVDLRQALGSKPILAAAVPHLPWLAASGSPVNNVSRAASALDYITLMNYDVWGSSSNPGPNAPLANLCGNSTQPAASAAAGVKQWAAAGMPRSKIILGIAGYGYINTSSKKTLRQRGEATSRETDDLNASWPVRPEPQRDPRYRAVPFAKRAQLVGLDGSSSDGQVNFRQLVDQGALKVKSDGTYGAGSGWTMYWDDCSDTPFLSNGNRVVTYDDTYSLYDKGSFAKQAGIAGVNMWSVDGDTSNWALMSAARSGMGL
ncbi:glycoside hydrolase [Ceraceosorus guamensis]|uniref:Glycoside hydrolase n=1 Tax=Ceraceosorus guamensis TaxID=1522189 RepID=A0A316VZ12_9BASI|nr:glycoside hydrolase [Ceraceosorus guamensis]PWN42750.1 glycoside hydrolase [Ceraceosorus guamensis]